MKKTAILPVVSVLCLAIAAITGHQIDASLQDEIATVASIAIGAGISIWGIYKDHKAKAAKKGDKK